MPKFLGRVFDMRKHRGVTGERNILRNNAALPLTDLNPGASGTIIRLDGGFGMRKRLTDLGVVPGRRATVLSSQKNSPLLVKIDDSRIMIGKGMASRIMVKTEE
jgi:ferrous iron transport protein A